MKKFFLIYFFLLQQNLFSQTATIKLAQLKYSGGGDWYANPTSLPNLAAFCNEQLKTNLFTERVIVEAGSPEIFNFPFVHITGHGNVVFSPAEVENLRKYLLGGGFLHVDDNYGMDQYVRTELRKLFPEHELIEVPFEHPVYHQKYDFPNGLPKIHEHDGKPPQGLGIFHEGRLVCFYSYETDLSDGWEAPHVHKDPEEKRQQALKMGANIISYAFMGR